MDERESRMTGDYEGCTDDFRISGCYYRGHHFGMGIFRGNWPGSTYIWECKKCGYQHEWSKYWGVIFYPDRSCREVMMLRALI